MASLATKERGDVDHPAGNQSKPYDQSDKETSQAWDCPPAIRQWIAEEASRIVIDLDVDGVYAPGTIDYGDATRMLEQFALAVAARVQPQWQPIETAPDDGRSLLLGAAHPDRGFGFVCDVGCFVKLTPRLPWNWGWSFAPTNWMPLPAAPIAEGGTPR